jgi:hypothetical protein
MRNLKLAGIGLLVACTILALGYLWGARGRWAAEEQLARLDLHLALADARREALAGSIDVQRLNFGSAAGHFETARVAAERARVALDSEGLADQAADAKTAVALLDEARSLAAKVNQAAGERAARATDALDRAAAQMPSR